MGWFLVGMAAGTCVGGLAMALVRAGSARGTCEFLPLPGEDWHEPNGVRGICSECYALMFGKDNYCSNCGRRVKVVCDVR